MASSVVLGSLEAGAQTAVLPSPPDTSEVRELRVAFASSPERSVLWFSAAVYGAADDVYVIVPAAPGARLDLSSDAWFEALQDATAPRVVPPSKPAECSSPQLPSKRDFELVGSVEHVPSVLPEPQPQLMTLSALVVWAQSAEVDLAFDDISKLGQLEQKGYRFVLLRYTVDPGDKLLRTVRVVSGPSEASLPLLLHRTGSQSVPTTLWVFAQGQATPKDYAPLHIDPSKVQWTLGESNQTNYKQLWDQQLTAAHNLGWVIETTTHQGLFEATPFAEGTQSVPSISASYLSRASDYHQTEGDSSACLTRIASTEASASQVAQACAQGALFTVPGGSASCQESPSASQLDPALFRCGPGVDDLAMAFSGQAPVMLWLSRWSGRIGAWLTKYQESFELGSATALSPVVVSADYDKSPCTPDGGTGGTGGSGTGGSGAGGRAGSGGAGGRSGAGGSGYPGGPGHPGSSDDDDEDDEGYDDSDNVRVETSCWGDSSSSSSSSDSSDDDSCGGDSSSSSSSDDDEHSSCGGDSDDSDSCSGDSSDDGDSACSGDSSDDGDSACSGDSSDDGDSACSGDSSDSSDGDSCSGGSGGSSSSDSCGSSSGSSKSDCAIAPAAGGHGKGKRRARMPTSAFTLLLAAGYLRARRLQKKQQS